MHANELLELARAIYIGATIDTNESKALDFLYAIAGACAEAEIAPRVSNETRELAGRLCRAVCIARDAIETAHGR